MRCMMLKVDNIEMLLEFEKRARILESEIFIEEFDVQKFKNQTLNALANPLFSSAKCLMCIDDTDNVVGRLDLVVLPSFAFGGDLRAYIDWIYVLKSHRGKGVAHFLLEQAEIAIKQLGAYEYFLITAKNDEADKLYRGLKNVKIKNENILTKSII